MRFDLKLLYRNRWLRILISLPAIALFVVLARYFGHEFPIFQHWVAEQGVWAPVIYVAVFVVLSVVSISAAAFAVAAGALFGLAKGFTFFLLAELISMALLFWIGRSLARKHIEKVFTKHPKFEVINRAVSSQGAKMVFLIRLTPVPFTAMSYLLAISRVRFSEYITGGLARAPIIFAEVYIGFTAQHITQMQHGAAPTSWIHYVVLGVGLVAAIGVSLYVHHVAKKALAEAEQA